MPSIDLFRHEPAQRIVGGCRIFNQGDRGNAMYAVIEGEIELTMGDHVLEVVGPGGVFGELALIDTKPRSATATARIDSRIVSIDEARFLYLIRNTPFFAIEVMQMLAERLRRMDAQAVR